MAVQRRLPAAGLARQTAGGLVLLLAAGGMSGCARRESAVPAGAAAKDLEGKRVVMIIAPSNFRDEELREPKAVLEGRGAQVTVACSSAGPARGMLGMTVTPDTTLGTVDAADYDAIVFVGGSGAKDYWHDPQAHALAQQGVAAGKVVAAICLAPVVLAEAGVLKLKKATVSSSAADDIEKRGAVYTGADVQVDGKIITAQGPKASDAFGRAIAEALSR